MSSHPTYHHNSDSFYLADFSRLGGTPPPTPLTENHFVKKPLAEMGGTPPLYRKNRQNICHKMVQKRAKLSVFGPKYLLIGGIFP